MQDWPWRAEIRCGLRKRIHLGTFDRAEQGAKAYDAACVALRGEDGVLNFPHLRELLPQERSHDSKYIREAAKRAAVAVTSSMHIEPSICTDTAEVPAKNTTFYEELYIPDTPQIPYSPLYGEPGTPYYERKMAEALMIAPHFYAKTFLCENNFFVELVSFVGPFDFMLDD